ncbi:histidine--tRNA ligase, putative [Plasmodium gallinaceum]|uniref:histidine--tRNA ligase n=1 Tax=Plasmodium gallinaceum TaxID=5849 RepID=A0A1J1H026_PLAGA|nr:histidine--tRNA ligase, putative [Plasmodium gallinaceum]CRG96890.1 histidine--tRNA ligase, putative [Plasmodium gallinaceum]
MLIKIIYLMIIIFLKIGSFKNIKEKKKFFFFFLLKTKNNYSLKKKFILNSVKGIRTFDSKNYQRREYLFKIWKNISKSFAYDFYDLPILENYDIFRKSNINESYDFVKNNRHLILRPEITPQLINYLFFKKNKLKEKNTNHDNNSQNYKKNYLLQNLKKVFKMCTIGQCFRYEKMSRCRKREHYQWNMDIIGIDNISAEIEIFTILISFFHYIKLIHNDIVFKINDKKIIHYIIFKIFKKSFDFSYNRTQLEIKKILHTLDKFHKINNYSFKLLLIKKCPYLKKRDIQLFNNVIHNITTLNQLEVYLNFNTSIYNDLKNLLSYFQKLNLHPFFQIDTTIVRGLDYYNNIIFEIFYKHKNYRAICGGGRYDFFLDGKKIFAVGFAMGDIVISEILFKNFMKETNLHKNINVVSFFPFIVKENIEDIHKEYYSILNILRNNNVKVYSLLQNNLKLSKALKKANSLNPDYFLFFQEKDNIIFLKNLKTRKQIAVNSQNILSAYNNF